MVVTTIYLIRHGFRVNWTVDPDTGTYYTNIPSPTGIPSDPALAAHGVHQSQQLATALSVIRDPPITSIYSSPFYRCLQTLQPFVEKSGLQVKGDNGLGEWYGLARFTHPSPASPILLNSLFPAYDLDYKPSIIPSSSGESVLTLHDRCAYALEYVMSREDAADEEERAILICTHAASMIAIGRALTGHMPVDICEDVFKTHTCGITKFVRRVPLSGNSGHEIWEKGMVIPAVDWRGGKGVAGGWNCAYNSECGHLDGGEERHWHFQGDEMFDDVDTSRGRDHGLQGTKTNGEGRESKL